MIWKEGKHRKLDFYKWVWHVAKVNDMSKGLTVTRVVIVFDNKKEKGSI